MFIYIPNYKKVTPFAGDARACLSFMEEELRQLGFEVSRPLANRLEASGDGPATLKEPPLRFFGALNVDIRDREIRITAKWSKKKRLGEFSKLKLLLGLMFFGILALARQGHIPTIPTVIALIIVIGGGAILTEYEKKSWMRAKKALDAMLDRFHTEKRP